MSPLESDPAPSPHPLGEWRTPKLSQKVAMAVVEDIVKRGLRPGDRLPAEAEMTRRFEISRASLREGLRVLETYGVITIRQGVKGGPEIGPLAPGDIARTLSLFLRLRGATYGDLFRARLLIEPVMCRMAAEQQDPAEMERLRRLLDLEASSPAEEYLDLSNRFHEFLSGMSANPVFDLLGAALRALYADRLFRARAVPDETLEQCRKAHPKIGEAILAGDGRSAETLMATHMSDLNRVVDERAAWFMDERVSWEV
jgi:GntR family transcriptional repressor for pyruvate dehydrogenase complex